jgi:major type 1 subunit fimbrin (pilin)
MNKTLLSAALIAGFGVAAFAPQAAHAVDGTINFTGAITASTCKINGAVAPATIAVTLPTVASTSLASVAATGGRTPFSIALSACTGQTKATTYFEPGLTTSADGNLKVATGGATNVELQLLNNDSTNSVINVAAASAAQNSAQLTLTAGAGTLNYYVQYYATAIPVGAGAANSSVQFSMIYQ